MTETRDLREWASELSSRVDETLEALGEELDALEGSQVPRPTTRSFQLQIIGFSTLYMTVLVTLTAHWLIPNGVPWWCWSLAGFTILTSLALTWDSIWLTLMVGMYIGVDNPYSDVRLPNMMRWWRHGRERYARLLIPVCALAPCLALAEAIRTTGGLRSPLATLLSVPVVIAAFVSQTKRGIFAMLVLSGALAVALVFEKTSNRAPLWAHALTLIAVLLFTGALATVAVMRTQVLLRHPDRATVTPETLRTLREGVLDAIVEALEPSSQKRYRSSGRRGDKAS